VQRLIVRRSHAPLRGRVQVPGDKSISHRALLLNSLAGGASQIRGFLPSADCLATLNCLQALGVRVERRDECELTVHGCGLDGLSPPARPLDCARSGTTMRLLAGILAGQSFDSVLTGEEQLLRRPMRRIADPLGGMGADVRTADGRAPLSIHGRPLHGCDVTLPVASAQVKSAILLAGLYADGPVVVRQPGPARDHTERMLAAMGAPLEVEGLDVTLRATSPLFPLSMRVPGDLSSAAFLLVAATLVPGSRVTVEKAGLNPTRTGLLDVLQQMGAELAVEARPEQGGEPLADLTMCAASLDGTTIQGQTVVRMIDEFPILAVAATQARGRTVVRDATELRVKETDRIATVAGELQKLGASIEPRADGFVVEGPVTLRGGTVDSHGDHRLGMALAVAGLVAEDEVVVEGAERIDDSFPGFADAMRQIGATIEVEGA